jgi:hypothetical protein
MSEADDRLQDAAVPISVGEIYRKDKIFAVTGSPE